ncbi:MAG: hypothetical protein AAB263_03705 [Planctomycetota bacterium]
MAVKPISDRGRQIILLLAHQRGPVLAADLMQHLPKLGAIDNDLAELIAADTLVARGTMTEAQLKRELEKVWPYLVKAQRTGQEFHWKTANTFTVELTKVGRDMVPLLAKPRI